MIFSKRISKFYGLDCIYIKPSSVTNNNVESRTPAVINERGLKVISKNNSSKLAVMTDDRRSFLRSSDIFYE